MQDSKLREEHIITDRVMPQNVEPKPVIIEYRDRGAEEQAGKEIPSIDEENQKENHTAKDKVEEYLRTGELCPELLPDQNIDDIAKGVDNKPEWKKLHPIGEDFEELSDRDADDEETQHSDTQRSVRSIKVGEASRENSISAFDDLDQESRSVGASTSASTSKPQSSHASDSGFSLTDDEKHADNGDVFKPHDDDKPPTEEVEIQASFPFASRRPRPKTAGRFKKTPVVQERPRSALSALQLRRIKRVYSATQAPKKSLHERPTRASTAKAGSKGRDQAPKPWK